MRDRDLHGRQLRALREQAGLRADQLANLVGCEKSYLANIEKGPDQPSAVLAYRFARALSEKLGRTVDINEFTTLKPEQGAA